MDRMVACNHAAVAGGISGGLLGMARVPMGSGVHDQDVEIVHLNLVGCVGDGECSADSEAPVDGRVAGHGPRSGRNRNRVGGEGGEARTELQITLAKNRPGGPVHSDEP